MSEANPDPPTEVPKARPESPRRKAIAALKHALQRSDPGTLASLRRWNSSGTPPAAFYRVATVPLDDVAPDGGAARDEIDQRWAVLAQLFAIALGTDPENGGLLGGPSFGEALGRAKVAERRVLRLLDAEPEALGDLSRHLVQQLVSRGQPFEPRDLADLILDPMRAESARRSIARNYYRHQDA